MATRTVLDSGTGGAITGDNYMDNVGAHITVFFNASLLRLTTIAGTADDPTAVVDPVMDTGLAAGMSFWFEPTSNNSGAMTLKIGAEAAKAIVQADGAALVSGDVLLTTSYLLFYDGTSFVIVSATGANTDGAALAYDNFTASGTLTKPTGFPANGLVIIEMWGGGGGGDSGTGGGGGAYNRKEFRGSDLGSTETVTIGGGGAAQAAGGTTSVGSLISAFGGGGASNLSFGGGGGQLAVGADGATDGGDGGAPFGGAGGVAGDGASGNAGGGGGGSSNDGGDGIWGGGGGGDVAGASLYGGGGGGVATGGASVFGGAGGASGVGGAIPAGGGGASSSTGARGEVDVRWVG